MIFINDVLMEIALFLPIRCVIDASLVNKQWKKCMRSNPVWKTIIERYIEKDFVEKCEEITKNEKIVQKYWYSTAKVKIGILCSKYECSEVLNYKFDFKGDRFCSKCFGIKCFKCGVFASIICHRCCKFYCKGCYKIKDHFNGLRHCCDENTFSNCCKCGRPSSYNCRHCINKLCKNCFESKTECIWTLLY